MVGLLLLNLLVELLHLVEAELHRRIATEDGHEHGELLGGGFHVGNDSGHSGERTIGNGDLVTHGIGDLDLAHP